MKKNNSIAQDAPKITNEDKADYGIQEIPEGETFMSKETHPEEMGTFMQCLGDKFLAAAAIAEAQEKSKNRS